MKSVADRLRAKIAVAPSGCWMWQGRKTSNGYGRITVDGKTRPAHRVAYELLRGPIPDWPDAHLDHLCRTPACVNPAHLEPVTAYENVIVRSRSPWAMKAKATHCIHGHPFDERNTRYRLNGTRQCRRCAADESRRRWWKNQGRPIPDAYLLPTAPNSAGDA